MVNGQHRVVVDNICYRSAMGGLWLRIEQRNKSTEPTIAQLEMRWLYIYIYTFSHCCCWYPTIFGSFFCPYQVAAGYSPSIIGCIHSSYSEPLLYHKHSVPIGLLLASTNQYSGHKYKHSYRYRLSQPTINRCWWLSLFNVPSQCTTVTYHTHAGLPFIMLASPITD